MGIAGGGAAARTARPSLALALAMMIARVSAEDGAAPIAEEDAASAKEDVESKANTTRPYVAPQVDGLHFAETFDGDVWGPGRWASSKQEKYNGAFKVEKRKTEAIIGDVGLVVPEEAKHYGAAVKFAPIEGQKDVAFVAQFEVKFQDGLTCGGSYIKLFDSGGKDASEFQDDTRYVIMFGPDRCGSTDKVHFILQHKNPKSGAWEEKHCKDPPSVPHDQLSHLYGLVIKPDNSFEILVDGEKKKSGNLLNDMQPPVNPPKEVDDPEDKKPDDWADEAKINDPTAAKPDDWDEDAPMQISDPKATKPDGWVDDAEKRIADPSAKQPDDWDEDEDGEWEAPIVDNPLCKVGCGTWEPPKISNPEYKGKWYAPKIDNPVYKGVWKAKQIPNPDYFEDDSPSVLPTIDAVGIDIWTMSKGILFDNIVIGTDDAKAKGFADQSWKIRKELEDVQQPKPSKSAAGGLWEMVENYWIPAAVTGIVLLVTIVFFCCCRGSGVPPPPPKTKKKEATPKQDEKKDESEDDRGNEKDDENEKEEEKDEKKEEKEGGIGDLND